jgi:hypothetical protein
MIRRNAMPARLAPRRQDGKITCSRRTSERAAAGLAANETRGAEAEADLDVVARRATEIVEAGFGKFIDVNAFPSAIRTGRLQGKFRSNSC